MKKASDTERLSGRALARLVRRQLLGDLQTPCGGTRSGFVGRPRGSSVFFDFSFGGFPVTNGC